MKMTHWKTLKSAANQSVRRPPALGLCWSGAAGLAVLTLATAAPSITDIVAMQQSYAKVSGLTENLSPVELIEDALRMNADSFEKHEVELVREIPSDLPRVSVDKHKVLQILVNLLRNAKHACEDAGRADKRITAKGSVLIIDNGGRVGCDCPTADDGQRQLRLAPDQRQSSR